MEMFVLFGKWCALVMDHVLGWLLYMPYDVSVLFVAIGTSLLMTVARRLVTNQDMMRRCKNDLASLKRLRKEAKANKDKKALHNIQMTVGMIQLKQMGAEMKGLALSVIPIIFLASWAFERLDFLPPQVGEKFTVRATFPVSACSNNAWLIIDPPGKLAIEPDSMSSVQEVRKDDNIDPETGVHLETPTANGLAEWRLRVLSPCESADLTIVYNGQRTRHTVRVGGRHYGDPLLAPDKAVAPWQDCTTQLVQRRAMFLSNIPGVTQFWMWWLRTSLWNLPTQGPGPLDKAKWYCWDAPLWTVSRLTLFAPWLAAYLMITVPFVPLLRKVMRVY